MKRQISIFFIIIILITGCDKEEEYDDPNYPTIIEELDSLTIYGIIDELAASPLSYCTSVDTFGFCFITDKLEGCNENEITLDSNLTLVEIETLFSQALTNYQNLLYVSDHSIITIQSVTTLKGKLYDSFFEDYPDSVQPYWLIKTGLQEYNEIPVRGTRLQMMISGNEITAIEGRRFQNIYIPGQEVYTADLAMEMLLDEELTYETSTLTPSTGTYWFDPEKVIVPISRSGSIELHVCWVLYPETWEVIVDCYTGKVLSSVDVSIL